MAKKRKAKRRGKASNGVLSRLFGERDNLRRVGLPLGVLLLVLSSLTVAVMGASRLDDYVTLQVRDRAGPANLAFSDLPDGLRSLALAELTASVDDVLDHDWTDDRMCRDIASRIATVGWVDRVDYVRRRGDAVFEVHADYRMPFALVGESDQFYLVDRDGVRLPGAYDRSPQWPVISGVAVQAPEPGARWSGEDLQAGLRILDLLHAEPFDDEVREVVVQNFDGRMDARRTHIELITDQPGGSVHWGSAPGWEIEENTVAAKLAILRENHRRTGRLDAGHAVIDIAVYPDRYTIPG